MFCGPEAGVVVARLFCFIVQIKQITQRERFSSFPRSCKCEQFKCEQVGLFKGIKNEGK